MAGSIKKTFKISAASVEKDFTSKEGQHDGHGETNYIQRNETAYILLARYAPSERVVTASDMALIKPWLSNVYREARDKRGMRS